MTGAEKRYWVDKLLDDYGAGVWTTVVGHYESIEAAEEAFVYVFTLAIQRMEKRDIDSVSDRWFEDLSAEAMQSKLPKISHEVDLVYVPDEEIDETLVDDGESSVNSQVPADSRDADKIVVPPLLYRRTIQMMRAAIALDEAMQHHRGPLWIKIGAICVVALGFCGVGYGVSNRIYARLHHAAPKVASASQLNLSQVAGNLPVTPVSIYQLSSTQSSIDLSHFVVSMNEVYQGTLIQSADSWPQIRVDGFGFGTGDMTLTAAKEQSFNIELVPPLQQSKSSTANNANWTIVDWRLLSMSNRWLTAVVTWRNAASGVSDTMQIYALNVENSNYSLVDTLRPQSGVSNRFAVAVGDGKIVVQPALDDGTGSAPLGLPIEIYTLTGADPLHAWTQSSQIPASFGLMDNPIATKDGILFQGIVGKNPTSSSNSSVWYKMSWSGQLSRLQGPPVDGQSHWAVRGQSGALWWVETTPVADKDGSGYQVSMGRLASNQSTSAVKNLNNPIVRLSTSGDDVLWIENTSGNKPRLVVAAVQ